MALRKKGKRLPGGSVPVGAVIWPFVEKLAPLLGNGTGPAWIRAVPPFAPDITCFINSDYFLHCYAAELLGKEALSIRDSKRGETANHATSIRGTAEQQRCLHAVAKWMGLPPGQLVRLAVRRWGMGFPRYFEEQEQLRSMVEGVSDWLQKQRQQRTQPLHA